MRLVTFGPTSIEEQFKATEAAFSKVPQGSASCRKPKSWALPEAWPANRLGKWVNMLGTTPQAQIWMMFPTPDLTPTYPSSPDYYLSYVFQYGGLNSLSRVLDDQLGLVSDLGFSSDTSSAGGRFLVIMDLTPLGQ